MLMTWLTMEYGDDDVNDIYNLDGDVIDLQANFHKQHSKAPAFPGNRLCQDHV